VFILKFFLLFFISGVVVVCSEGLQKHVDYTSHTHNINDSSENTGKSIHFLKTPNDRKIDMDRLLFENILLQHIMLEYVRCIVIKLCLCSNNSMCETACEPVAVGRLCIKWFGGQKGGSATAACVED